MRDLTIAQLIEWHNNGIDSPISGDSIAIYGHLITH